VTRGHGYQLSDEPKTPPIPLSDLVRDSPTGLRAVLRHGGGGRATDLICGAFEFDGADTKSFLGVLPEWIRVQKDERRGNDWLDATIRFLTHETYEPGGRCRRYVPAGCAHEACGQRRHDPSECQKSERLQQPASVARVAGSAEGNSVRLFRIAQCCKQSRDA
jgi:Cupin